MKAKKAPAMPAETRERLSKLAERMKNRELFTDKVRQAKESLEWLNLTSTVEMA